ncbi:MAG: sugar-binding domain-containing protein, partial [Lachnospiraceae bacterium]
MRDLDFNRGWVFTQEGTSRREEVTLPHDAMLHTKRNPKQPLYFLLAGFEAGKYIYTKQFQMGEDEAANTHLLEFEGVYCNATVTVNGKEAARHVYGYTPFLVDLDPFLRFGTENEIQVVCDVPKEGHNRWYTGGGIYRPVHLYVGAKAYFLPNQVRVTTLGIHPAKIRVEALVHQGNGMKAVIRIRPLGIYKGEEPWSSETFEKEHEEEENILCAQETIPVYGDLAFSEILLPDATLWSAAHPYLYEAELDLVDDGGRVVDHTAVSFGVRQIRVDAEQGLLVNEEPTFLRGGCIHN